MGLMKNTYCTLFNYDYLTRGLSLYKSMERCIDDFHLYILAMDRETKVILEEQRLSHATVIDISEVADDELSLILGERFGPSLFWTCTPFVIEYVLKVKNEQWCTYVDADCYFLKDPGTVFDIIDTGGYSVGIVEHRFREDGTYDSMCKLNGRFNVAFNTFRNEENSLQILEEWKKQCIDSCTGKPDGEVFGDQLYLNEWPNKHSRVYIVEDAGVDVAPWNVNNYRFIRTNGNYMIEDERGLHEVKMYHFHALRYFSPHLISLNLWNVKSRSDQKYVFELYKEYVYELKNQQKIVDRYPQYYREIKKESFVTRMKTLYSKYTDRMENGIIDLIRNVIWV